MQSENDNKIEEYENKIKSLTDDNDNKIKNINNQHSKEL